MSSAGDLNSSNLHLHASTFRSWLIGLILMGGLCWLFPPFHIIPLRQAQQQQQLGEFNSPSFAEEFWQKKLLPAAARAVALTELAAALTQEPNDARRRFGHSPGLSDTSYFFVRGLGRITNIGKETIAVALDGPAPQLSVELVIGPLFGNTVRDATGLLNVSDFPNSQDFNGISTELNHIVETQVVPALLERAAIGKAIGFTGCAELEEGSAPATWKVIPVKVEWL